MLLSAFVTYMFNTVIIIGGLIVLFYLLGLMVHIRRRKKSKNWDIGDLVKMKPRALVGSGNELLTLVGWNSDYIFVDDGKHVNKCEWSDLDFNKSAEWRKNFFECEKYMGKEPLFSNVVSKITTKKTYDGKPIELMNEVECQVYLKKAIEEENFELAELIRKRLENFQ